MGHRHAGCARRGAGSMTAQVKPQLPLIQTLSIKTSFGLNLPWRGSRAATPLTSPRPLLLGPASAVNDPRTLPILQQRFTVKSSFARHELLSSQAVKWVSTQALKAYDVRRGGQRIASIMLTYCPAFDAPLCTPMPAIPTTCRKSAAALGSAWASRDAALHG